MEIRGVIIKCQKIIVSEVIGNVNESNGVILNQRGNKIRYVCVDNT